MRVTKRVNLLAVLALIAVVKAGLLRVPKIYNTVITSDGNLEPSRAYPIVQSVLSVGVAAVQPVLAVAPEAVAVPVAPHAASASVTSTAPSDATILKQTHARHLYPIAVGGLYPLLATTNALYPTVLYHHQPVLAPVVSVQQQHVSGTVPVARSESGKTIVQQQQHQQQQGTGDVLNNNHRLNNPGIPDVPPPPLPVSANKNV